MSQLHPNLAQSILGWRGLKFLQIRTIWFLKWRMFFFFFNECFGKNYSFLYLLIGDEAPGPYVDFQITFILCTLYVKSAKHIPAWKLCYLKNQEAYHWNIFTFKASYMIFCIYLSTVYYHNSLFDFVFIFQHWSVWMWLTIN